jgi:hypothetical protein
MEKVRDHPERFSPFQRSVPSAKRLYNDGGALDAINRFTPVGLWNVILFRAITYQSPFSTMVDYVFRNLSGWQKFARDHALDYFLGPHNDSFASKEQINLAVETQWRLAHGDELSNWLTTRRIVPYHFLRAELQQFPGICVFRAHDIALDYVNIYLVGLPSAEDVAELAVEAGNQGLLPSDWTMLADKAQVRGAFLQLVESASVELTSQEKAAMGFDSTLLLGALMKMAILEKAVRKVWPELLAW